MAHPEHLDWLLQGPDFWNAKRTEDPFGPDLSEEDISNKFSGGNFSSLAAAMSPINLRRANLAEADLRNSIFRGIDLTEGKISNTDFTNANLIGTNFSNIFSSTARFMGATLTFANFSDAELYSCDFSEADLTGANLKGARFWGCSFDGADLHNANLIGTDFVESRPWRARLFPPSDPTDASERPMPIKALMDVNHLLDACRDLREKCGDDWTLYFRGEGRSSWELRPSLMRIFSEGSSFRPFEGEMLNDLITLQPQAFYQVDSALGQWVFAQHHRLKTRLLDITRNPLVALFNACEGNDDEDGRLHAFAVPNSLIKPFNSNSIRIITNFAKLPRTEQNLLLGKSEADTVGDVFRSHFNNTFEIRDLISRARSRLYALIRGESPNFEERIDIRDLFRVFVVEPQHMFERLKVQSGAFLISAFHERFEREEVLKRTEGVPIYAHHTLTVPYERKRDILDNLRLLNVTSEVLMPSVDASANAVTDKYRSRAQSGDPC